MQFSGAQDAKEVVRRACDIVDVVGGYLPLRRQGRGYVCLCPWHDDSRPSLQINPDRQSWRCWVCADGGDVFSFVMKKEGINFREALVMLAEKAGVDLPEFRGPAAAPGSPDDKQTLYAAMQWAERLYHECLLRSAEAEPGRKYLAERGLSKDSIVKYKLGFAPDQWQWLMDRAKNTSFSFEVLESVGLVSKSERGTVWERFKGRVLFPIRDTQARCVSFGGRVLPGNTDPKAGKYVNCPETRLYSKSHQLYGLDIARDAIAKQRRAIVMEGYTDVIMAQQHGLATAVAVCGTALTSDHIRLLQRFSDCVVLVLDGDAAGQKRAKEILDLFLAHDVDLRIMTLPDELDPCDFFSTRGMQEFETLLGGVHDALDHLMRVELAGLNPLDDLHRANVTLERILARIAKARQAGGDKLSLSALREQQTLMKLAKVFHLTELDIRSRLTELRKQSGKPAAATKDVEERKSYGSAAKIDPWELELLEVLLLQPEAAPAIAEAIGPAEIAGEAPRKIYEAYCHFVHRGLDCDFSRVLGELPDGALQSFLIEVDDLCHARTDTHQAQLARELGQSDPDRAPELRVRDLVAKFEHRRREREDRERISQMRVDGPEKVDADQQLFAMHQEEQRRRREEIAAHRKEEVKRR